MPIHQYRKCFIDDRPVIDDLFTAAATVSGGTADAVSSTTIPLPAGNYATLNLLGAAAHGSQTNQRFVVTYTDGTTTTITQSLSDWWGPPQNYTGESPGPEDGVPSHADRSHNERGGVRVWLQLCDQ